MEDDDQQQRIIAGVTDLMERIGHLRREMDGLRAKKENLASMASAARKTWSSCKEEGSLEDDVAKVTAEIKVMRSSVPEGYPEDENVQYFLMVAELEKSNKVLREQLAISEKNLEGLREDLEAANGMKKNIEEINQVLKASRNDKNAGKGTRPPTAKIPKIQAECEIINHKIRGTKVVYKKIRDFLAEMLKKIAPPEEGKDDSEMAMFLQELWNTFNEDSEAYIDLPDLTFDVGEALIVSLLKNGIIERNPDKDSEYRMVDFTR